MNTNKVASADEMCQVIKSSGHLLAVLDDKWSLESALLKSLSGATAESRASYDILKEFPTADNDVKMEHTIARLQTLKSSQALKLSPTNVQAALTFVLTHLGNLSMGITLDVTLASCSKLARAALAAFQFYCVLDIIGEEDVPTKIRGEPAYKVIFERCLDLTTRSQDVPADMFDQLVLYRWLSPADRESEVVQLIDQLQKAGNVASKKAKLAAGKAAAKPAAGEASSSSAGNSTAKSAARNMFD